jgi:NADH-quinone oxidoreductase subunit A
MLKEYFPLLVVLAMTIGLAFIIIILSTILGTRKPTKTKLMPYECGMEPIGSARGRFSIKFFIIAMLFIIFDIEVIFLYPWAVIFRELKLFGFVEMGIFILILFLGLIYVWRKGALEWE